MRYLSILLLCLITLLLNPEPSRARTWNVYLDGSGDAPYIQAAIDSSANGDTVLVWPGVYEENPIRIENRSLTLTSAQGRDVTTISNILWIRGDNTEDVSVLGFNIVRGMAGSPMKANYLNSILLSDCRIENFWTHLELVYINYIFIENCVFNNIQDQDGHYGGGALLVVAQDESIIRKCQFIDNSSPYGFPSWEYTGGGGALSVSSSGHHLITECLFLRNEAPSGGALFTSGVIEFSHNTLIGNTSGDAAYVVAGSGGARINENIFAWNNSLGLRCWSGAPNNSCNAYWQNEGAEEGFCGPNDNLLLDPQFCDPDNDDFHLLETSPLLPENRPDGYEICDGIFGAFGMGCVGPPPAIRPTTWGIIKSLYRSK